MLDSTEEGMIIGRENQAGYFTVHHTAQKLSALTPFWPLDGYSVDAIVFLERGWLAVRRDPQISGIIEHNIVR